MENIMANSDITVNNMGSVVVDGYKCKPVKLDSSKPIMHFKTQIFLCDGQRCSKASKSEDLANELREVLRSMNLHVGKSRIKISRANCFGACRYRQVGIVFENTRSNGNIENNNIWLKNIHKFNRDDWIKLFRELNSNRQISFEQIEMEEVSE
jgi:hypothetical protein